MKIKNLDQLRKHALKALENLSERKITIEEAGATSKLCENVVSTIKLQLEFAKMINKQPQIEFMGDNSNWIPIIPKKLSQSKDD